MEQCDLCACSDLDGRGQVSYCNGEEAVVDGTLYRCKESAQGGVSWPPIIRPGRPAAFDWTQKYVDTGSDFLLMEHRATSAVGYVFVASLVSCVATCRGTPNCPGVVFLPSSRKCGIIDPFRLRQLPINRANEHMVVRLGFQQRAEVRMRLSRPRLASRCSRLSLRKRSFEETCWRRSTALPCHRTIQSGTGSTR